MIFIRRFLLLFFLAVFASAQAQETQKSGSEERVVVYLGATLVNLDGGASRPNSTILVRGERIEAVADAAGFAIPKGARIVDVAGTFLVPGFINSHVHLATPPDRPYALAILRRDIYGGVTAVRDMDDDSRVMSELAYGARFNEFPAPDIAYVALFAGPGFFDDPRVQASSRGEIVGQTPWMRQINADTDLAEAITLARGTSASAIKTYANMDADTLMRIVTEAHRQKIPVWSHAAVFPASPLDVARSGADTMSHVCMIAYQAQKMPVTYHRRADVDESPFASGMPMPVNEVFAEMKKRGTVLDATLYVYATIERMRKELPEGQGPPIYCSAALAGRITKSAHQAGVEISVGTDSPSPADDPYPAVQGEMELLVQEAGMSPIQALRSATLIGARSMGRESEMGTIETGKLANLVFLSADPTHDISATRKIVLTVKRGREFSRKDFVMPSAKELGEETE